MTGSVAATEPGPDWETPVAARAVEIVALLSERSSVSQAVAQIEASTAFATTIVAVELERLSKRALVTMRSRPTERRPDGIEHARSERYDDPLGRLMAQRLRSLVGHRVTMWIEREAATSSPDRKVRVIRHVVDLGADPSFTAAAEEAVS